MPYIWSLLFQNVKAKYIPELRLHCPNVPILLIGTKIDLRTDEESIKRLNDLGLEAISTAQGMEMSKEIGAKQYMECSALESIGVQSIFDEAIQIFSQSLEPQSSSTWYVTQIGHFLSQNGLVLFCIHLFFCD